MTSLGLSEEDMGVLALPLSTSATFSSSLVAVPVVPLPSVAVAPQHAASA